MKEWNDDNRALSWISCFGESQTTKSMVLEKQTTESDLTYAHLTPALLLSAPWNEIVWFGTREQTLIFYDLMSSI